MAFGVKIVGLFLILIILSNAILGLAEKNDKIPDKVLFLIITLCIVVISFYMCLLSDKEEIRKKFKRVRKRIKKRNAITDSEFNSFFEEEVVSFARQVRKEVASFLGVSEKKISPNDYLWQDLEFDCFDPSLSWRVILKVFPGFGKQDWPIVEEIVSASENMKFSDWIKELKIYRDKFVSKSTEN